MGATYSYYKCVHCGGVSKVERHFDGMKFGNPFYNCQRCGKLNYDEDILEPALLAPEQFIADKKKRFDGWFLMLFLVGVFLFFGISMWMDRFLGGFIFVGIPVLFLAMFMLRKRSRFDDSGYEDDIQKSMMRLEQNPEYARAVIQIQKIDKESVWDKKYGSQTIEPAR